MRRPTKMPLEPSPAPEIIVVHYQHYSFMKGRGKKVGALRHAEHRVYRHMTLCGWHHDAPTQGISRLGWRYDWHKVLTTSDDLTCKVCRSLYEKQYERPTSPQVGR